jgi:hypothetical protein
MKKKKTVDNSPNFAAISSTQKIIWLGSCLKIKILVQDRGGDTIQAAGILKYV